MGNSSKVKFLDTFDLTDVQRQAADWQDGAALLLAGPGSGKTRVLTARIARILAESRDENFRILALTFTTKAASEMRGRIANLIPEMQNRLFVGTFHSFCAEVLRNQGSALKISPDFEIYSEDKDLQEVIQDACSKTIFKRLRALGVDNLLPIIQYLQRNLIKPGASLEGHCVNVELQSLVSEVYVNYIQRMKELNAMDFNMLVQSAFELFEARPYIARHYCNIYPYISMDEFQDTNYAQYQLIRSLTKNKLDNVFAVADEDQIIYQWNGASFKRILDFVQDFNAVTLQLPDNFRCPADVVMLANKLISHNHIRTPNKAPLIARKPFASSSILVKGFETFEQELSWVVESIADARPSTGSTAVIARTRGTLKACFEKLQNRGVPVVQPSRKNTFESPPMAWLNDVVRLANKRNDRRALSKVLENGAKFLPFSVGEEALITWSEATDGDLLKSYVELMRHESNDHQSRDLFTHVERLTARGEVRAFIDDALKWFASYNNCFETEDWGPICCQEQEDFLGLVEEIWRNYDQVNLNLGAFLQELQIMSKQGDEPEDAVQCLTVHGSKGKEFDLVYMIGIVEGELPSYQSVKSQSAEKMEEERRNCYVGLTRTVEKVTITYHRLRGGRDRQPSRFLREMELLDNQ